MESEAESSVTCPKCGHLNDPDAESCVECQCHLLVVCRDCGTKNQRADKKCAECGAELHRIKRKRRKTKLFQDGRVVRLMIVGGLLVVGIGVWVLLRMYVFKEPVQ